MKWKPLFALLLGLLMVGVTAGSAMAIPSSPQNPHARVMFMRDFQAKLLADTPTRQIFTFGDLLIDYKTNGREAKIIIKNTTTSKIIDVIHVTSTKVGDLYLLTLKDTSGVTYSTMTPINMIAPGLRTKQLISKPVINKESITITAYTKQQHYWWDGVYFVKGYMIKYPHPDYEHYGIEPWDSVKISGRRLIHYHFSQRSSQVLAYAAPVVFAAAIGAKIGGPWGSAALAFIALLVEAYMGSTLLDEYGCIWVWQSYEFQWKFVGPPYMVTRVPKYFRVADHTLINDMGLSDP